MLCAMNEPVTIRQPRRGLSLLIAWVVLVVGMFVCAGFVLPFTGSERAFVVAGVAVLVVMVGASLVYRARISSLTVGSNGLVLRGLFLHWEAGWSDLARVEYVQYRSGTTMRLDYVLLFPAAGVRTPSIGVPTHTAVARQLGRGAEPFVPFIAGRFEGGHEAILDAFRRYAPSNVTVSGA